jgi:hypothetical protein
MSKISSQTQTIRLSPLHVYQPVYHRETWASRVIEQDYNASPLAAVFLQVFATSLEYVLWNQCQPKSNSDLRFRQ